MIRSGRAGLVAFLSIVGVVGSAPGAPPAAPSGPPAAELAPRTEAIDGAYVQARLRVEAGWPAAPRVKDRSPRPYTLLIGLRDGVPDCAWAVGMNGPEVVHFRGADARLTAEALRGTITLFYGDGSTGSAAAEVPVVLDLRRTGARLEGTVAVGGEKPAKAEGTLAGQEELAKANALAPGQAWPCWSGADRGVRGPAGGVRMVDSLSAARPVWRSEAAVPTAFGNAADFRYALRAAAQGTCGGASSPVVAGGRVFQFYYQPSGAADEKALGAALAKAGDKPLAEFQKAWVRDMYRDAADDVVVAMDAASGRTLWRTTLPLRDLNLQTHKHRGVNPTPLAAGDRLYVVSYVGRVYCLDAASGQVRWEYPRAAEKAFSGARGQGGSGNVPVGCASPVLVGGVLGVTVRDRLVAIDAATGAERWQAKVAGDGELYPWRADGTEYFVTVGTVRGARGKKERDQSVVSLVDPADGRVLWQRPADFARQYRLPVLAGDVLVAYGYGAEAANNVTGGEQNSLTAVRLTKGGLEPVWQLKGLPGVVDSYGLCAAGAYVYLSGEREVWAIGLADGKVVGKVRGTGGARTQVLYSAEDRLFLLPEGRHGRSGVIMLSAAGPGMTLFPVAGGGDEEAAPPAAAPAKPAKTKGGDDEDGGEGSHGWRGMWHTPNPNTTAYSNHQIIYPVVDGRLFVRGADGVYCYDLRASGR